MQGARQHCEGHRRRRREAWDRLQGLGWGGARTLKATAAAAVRPGAVRRGPKGHAGGGEGGGAAVDKLG